MQENFPPTRNRIAGLLRGVSKAGHITVAKPPAVNINGTDPFGYLNNKVGGRTFQITARVNFWGELSINQRMGQR
jgi:hypothetical protein